MKQNLHTHSTYCDGKSTIKEMIRSALLRDFEVLGFSGHSFTDFDTGDTYGYGLGIKDGYPALKIYTNDTEG